MFQTHAELIEEKGGPAAFGAAINARAATVRMWKLRRRIPRSAWPEIVEAFPEVTLTALKGTEAEAAA